MSLPHANLTPAGPVTSADPQAPALPPVPASQTDASQTAPVPAPVAPADNPAIAEDVDLIEKEWVVKAKQIVEQTKHDPYKQNEEITKMKADYLKKRYNHDVKTNEAA